MTKIHFILIFVGSGLFLWDFSFGAGWLLGWLFAGLLRQYRVKLLERLIDFNDFSVKRYVGYLLIVMGWIALPLLLSFFIPTTFNPFAVFSAFFAERILMYALNIFSKEG